MSYYGGDRDRGDRDRTDRGNDRSGGDRGRPNPCRLYVGTLSLLFFTSFFFIIILILLYLLLNLSFLLQAKLVVMSVNKI